jgi:hypothetical protein
MPEIKLTDEAFLSILRENGGLYAVTAKAISETYAVTYTRQAVRQRALEHPEELKDIEEEMADIAEEGLQSLMKDQDPRIKIDAIKFYLKTKGKKRGYVERTEIEHSGEMGITWHEERTYEKPGPTEFKDGENITGGSSLDTGL